MTNGLTLGEYVRYLRRRKSWNLQQLSQASSLSVSHLSRLENDNNLPNAETVVKLSAALDGDLEHMLEMADCLPAEILERLLRKVGGGASPHKCSAGIEPDSEYARALIEDIDETLRTGLARQFNVTENDVDGLYTALKSLAQMEPVHRDAVIQFLAAFTRGNQG